ncbi:MAG: serine hydrolase domain-containing protein [Bacteroidales bacterium]
MKSFDSGRYFYHRFLAIVTIVAMMIVSCSKDSVIEPPAPKSDLNELLSFSFMQSDNPLLTQDCYPVKSGNIYYITVSKGANVSSLKAKYSASDKATVKIGGVLQTGGASLIDYTNTTEVTVTSESGKVNTYKLLVQEGNINLDRLVYTFMTTYSIPGISYAITKDEEIVYKSGLGFAIQETGERTKPNHLFRLASISKQFTTLCIMRLMEEGKLSLDRNVFGAGGVLESEFPNVAPMASTVTVRNLLQHNSGWPKDPDPMFTDSFDGQTLDQRINYVLGCTQVTPGTKYAYFNMGFGILGKVIEKITGKGYETYLNETMALAGVTDVHVGGDKSQRRSNEVVYYSQSGTNGYGNEMQVIAAAGGVIASTEDMMKLLFHIDGLSKVKDIITAETRATMLTPSAANSHYALGWMLNHSYFPGSVYHTGNLAGTATMWVMGGNGINCVVLCNSRSYITGFDDELYGLLRDILNHIGTHIV